MSGFDAGKNDFFCENLISKEDSKKILDWLNDSDKEVLLGESFFREDIEGMVAELLQSNCKEIWAVDVHDEGEVEAAKAICIHLPDDKSYRDILFDFSNFFIEDQGFDALEDHGQSYIYIPFD